jgi:cbb3-type cytochrome oxidase subunit 1
MMPAPARGSSIGLPLRYLVAATAAFLLAGASLPWLARELAGHYYQPRILALVHTVTLGWITLTIMGASYQIIPIVLERRVWSERLGRWQFVLLVTGTLGMIGHFFIGEWSGLVWGAGLVAVGTVAHLVNAVMSIRGLRPWTFTARLIALALTGFAMTLVFGLALAVNRL